MLLTFLSITLLSYHPQRWCQKCLLVLPCATSRMTLRSTLILHVTRQNIYKWKESTSAQIIYHYNTLPGSILGIVIYIFTTGKNGQLEYVDNSYVCVYTKIWEGERGNSKLPRLCHQGINCIRVDISWFRCGTRIGSLRMTSADNDNELRLASGNTCRTLQKGKDYGPSYLKLGMFSLIQKTVMSRTWVGFMLSFWV